MLSNKLDRVFLIVVWYEFHLASPPSISSMIFCKRDGPSKVVRALKYAFSIFRSTSLEYGEQMYTMGLELFSIAAFQASPLTVAFGFRSLFLPITSIPIHHLFLLVVGLASSTIPPPAGCNFSGREQNFFMSLSRFLFKREMRSQIFFIFYRKICDELGEE